ncbi:MAG: GGDEF domain-containing protein [Gammaproteobacteria bacterium]|nr:GGDEF domain-containing protein [Gammaproteobacteria bacterium]
MTDSISNFTTGLSNIKNLSAPSLKKRLRISIIVIILPLFLFAIAGFFFFQKSTSFFSLAIDGIVSDVIPVTELKDKIQQTVTPFNLYLKKKNLDDKNKFLSLSDEVKAALVNPIKLEQKNHSLANDIYHSAYLNWRNAHRTATKIFAEIGHKDSHISHQLLQGFYKHVIATTLSLDKLHLAMQNRVDIRFQKAKALKLDVLFVIGVIFLVVYMSSLGTIIVLNRSIIKPLTELEQWTKNFSLKEQSPELHINSYQELEYIASTYNKLGRLLHDNQTILKQQSLKDELTQLNNRRCFISRINDEHNRHQRYNNNYSLILIDIDHMTAVSQNYGEQVCDLTLVKISEMLQDAIRPTDFIARYGSDEFVMILPEVEAHGANNTAERIRNSISEHVFKINEFKFGITVSIGIALIQENITLKEILNCADYALQKSKVAGRNQVQFGDLESLKASKFKEKYLKESDTQLS